jgi:N-acetylglucosamine-6-phosphate deacetylase
MTIALVNGRVLTPGGFVEGQAVIVEGRRIAALAPDDAVPDGVLRHDLGGATLCPGFIDSQVNGGGGVLFNADTSVAAIRRIGAAHRRFGTTAFLPTLISDTLDTVARGIAAVEQAIAEGVPGVIGIHIEGPFLSADRKGVHDPAFFRTLAPEHVALLTSLNGGVTLITLAPERADPALIRALREAGAVVALGHSDAPYATASAAFDAG